MMTKAEMNATLERAQGGTDGDMLIDHQVVLCELIRRLPDEMTMHPPVSYGSADSSLRERCERLERIARTVADWSLTNMTTDEFVRRHGPCALREGLRDELKSIGIFPGPDGWYGGKP